MHRVVVSVLFFSLFLAAPGLAGQDRIAVMELAAKSGIKQAQLDVLSDMLATEIRNIGKYEVVTRSDIQSMLGLERAKELVGCDDASCLAEIGGALGVSKLVTGNVAAFGNVFAMNLKIIDIKKARVQNSIFEKIPGGEAALLDAIPIAVRKLLKEKSAAAPPPPPPPPPPSGDGGNSGTQTAAVAPPAPAGSVLSAKELEGRSLYLRYNLRVHKGRATVINYQRGDTIPAGSQIRVGDIGKKKVELIGPGGKEIELVYAAKYTKVRDPAQWLQTVMSHTDPSGEWAGFSAQEREGMQTATVSVGMSKKAVLATLGWPPAHKTKSLESKKWVYWAARGYLVVHFDGDRVSKVGPR